MRLKPDDLIAGVAARRIRELFRFYSRGIREEGIAHRLGVSSRKAKRLLAELLEQDFLAPHEDHPFREGWYSLTTKANAVVNAKFLKPLARLRAERVVAEVVARCSEANRNAEFTQDVKTLYVFGSFNTESPDVGDIDLIIETEWRPGIGSIVEASFARLELSGKRPRNYAEELLFGELEVKRFAMGRSPYLSVHDPRERLGGSAKAALLFEADHQSVQKASRSYGDGPGVRMRLRKGASLNE